MSRAPHVALGVLAFGVAFGCLFFGAPPRFGEAHGAAPWFATFLETLTPFLVVQLSIALAALLLFVQDVAGGPDLPLRERCARVPLSGLLVLAFLQSIPLDGAFATWAPFSATTYARLSDGGPHPLTLWRDGTFIALWTLAGMWVASTATTRAVRVDRERGTPLRTASVLLGFLATIALLQCVYGFYETWLADDGYLGLAKLSGKNRVTGTFIHGTMLAVWAGMGACAALALAARRLLPDDTSRAPRVALLVVVAAVTLVGAQFSLSRLGFAAAGVGALFVLWQIARPLADAGHALAARVTRGAVVGVPAVGLLLVLVVPRFRQRVGYLTDWLQGVDVPEEPRFAMWSSTWDLVREAPLLGTGIGSFGRAIHLVQADTIPQELWFAHSDLLNLLSDGGVVGLALGLAWVFVAWKHGAPALRDGSPASRVLAAGAFGGALVVLVAALADFQTQFPVVALPLAALLALPAALLPPGRVVEDAGSRWMHRLSGFLAAGVVLAATGAALEEHGERREHQAAGHLPGPTAAERHVIAGRALLETRDPANVAAALALFGQAADDDPLYDRAHLWRAIALVKAGERDESLEQFGRARLVSRGHTDVNLLIGQVYLDLLDRADAPYGPTGDSAFAALREAGALAPAAFAEAFRLGVAKRLSADELKRLVPERAHAWIHYADYLRRTGEDAEQIVDALERAVAAEPRHLAARLRLVGALLRAGRAPAARPHALRILTQAPDDETFVRALVRAYDAAGRAPAAREIFAEASVPYPDAP